MVKFVSSKEMFQNTEEFVQKEHIKMFATGPVLMWFVIWHNKESRGHDMETNQVQITTMLQFHITFLGLGRRPFFAPGDTRPASTMPGDDYSKQFRRELLQ